MGKINNPNDKPFNPRNARQPDAGIPYVIAENAPPHYISGHGRVGGGALVRLPATLTPGNTMMRLTEDEYSEASVDDGVRSKLATKAKLQVQGKPKKAAAGAAKDGPTVKELRDAQDAATAAEEKAKESAAEADRLRAELAKSEEARVKAEKAAAGAAPPAVDKKADSDKPKP